MSFISIMKKIGQDVKIAFEDVVKYLPAVAPIASMLFPEAGVGIAVGSTVVELIQKTVVAIEQKFAAAGSATGTGPAKLATVISIVEPTVVSLLTEAHISIDSDRVSAIVNAIVAILNAQAVPITTP